MREHKMKKNKKIYIKNKITNKEFKKNEERKKKLKFLNHKERVKLKKEIKEIKRVKMRVKWDLKKMKKMIKSTRYYLHEILNMPEDIKTTFFSKLCNEGK